MSCHSFIIIIWPPQVTLIICSMQLLNGSTGTRPSNMRGEGTMIVISGSLVGLHSTCIDLWYMHGVPTP